MPYFVWNKNANKELEHHEIHNLSEGCRKLPKLDDRMPGALGDWFLNCEHARQDFKIDNPSKSFNGCKHCCNDCHDQQEIK